MKARKTINVENLSTSPKRNKKTMSSHALGRLASVNSPCSDGLLDVGTKMRKCVSKNNSNQSNDLLNLDQELLGGLDFINLGGQGQKRSKALSTKNNSRRASFTSSQRNNPSPPKSKVTKKPPKSRRSSHRLQMPKGLSQMPALEKSSNSLSNKAKSRTKSSMPKDHQSLQVYSDGKDEDKSPDNLDIHADANRIINIAAMSSRSRRRESTHGSQKSSRSEKSAKSKKSCKRSVSSKSQRRRGSVRSKHSTKQNSDVGEPPAKPKPMNKIAVHPMLSGEDVKPVQILEVQKQYSDKSSQKSSKMREMQQTLSINVCLANAASNSRQDGSDGEEEKAQEDHQTPNRSAAQRAIEDSAQRVPESNMTSPPKIALNESDDDSAFTSGEDSDNYTPNEQTAAANNDDRKGKKTSKKQPKKSGAKGGSGTKKSPKE